MSLQLCCQYLPMFSLRQHSSNIWFYWLGESAGYDFSCAGMWTDSTIGNGWLAVLDRLCLAMYNVMHDSGRLGVCVCVCVCVYVCVMAPISKQKAQSLLYAIHCDLSIDSLVPRWPVFELIQPIRGTMSFYITTQKVSSSICQITLVHPAFSVLLFPWGKIPKFLTLLFPFLISTIQHHSQCTSILTFSDTDSHSSSIMSHDWIY